MKVYLGIDLGSTTSKAVLVDENADIVGRGITNTRANYTVAAEIARMEAEFNTRFTLLRRAIAAGNGHGGGREAVLARLQRQFQYLQFEKRYDALAARMHGNVPSVSFDGDSAVLDARLADILPRVRDAARARFVSGEVSGTSEFFRDLFGGAYLAAVQEEDAEVFDPLILLFDRSITPVENSSIPMAFTELTEEALAGLSGDDTSAVSDIRARLPEITALDLEPADYIGTGYGRQLLPFDQHHIKSEILCHAMGAHACFPNTRTVLDIGGQDTKAIQVDEHGLVTSFQMNDRCAAGCGRYLGYIADEMNASVSELGPIALEASYEANICSTCTVFAGAELREYLNLGERKENILAGLHLAIVQRAFALLARSGGVREELTFTGGVARNPAVVKYVSRLVVDNYGETTINIHPDSIFMGALGAALFSRMR